MDALGTERFFLLRSSFDKYDLVKVSSFSLHCFFFPFLTAAFKAGSVLCAQAGEAEFLNSWLRLPWGSVPPTHPRVRAELGLTHKQLWKCAKCAKCRGDITQAQRGALWGWGNRHKGTGSHPSTPSQASSNILLGSWNPAPLCLLSPSPRFGSSSPDPAANRHSQPQSKRETLGMARPETERAATKAPNSPKRHSPGSGNSHIPHSRLCHPKDGLEPGRGTLPTRQSCFGWVLLTQDPSGWKSPVRSSSPALNPAMPRPPCPQVPHLHSL